MQVHRNLPLFLEDIRLAPTDPEREAHVRNLCVQWMRDAPLYVVLEAANAIAAVAQKEKDEWANFEPENN